MWLDVIWVVLGLFFLIAIMALVLNPPELWIKRALHRINRGKRD